MKFNIIDGSPICRCGGSHFKELHGDKIAWKCSKCQLIYSPPPALKSPEEILEFVREQIKALNKVPTNYIRKRLIMQAKTIEQFITGAKDDE